MTWPHSQDYNELIQDPASCFGDAELKQGEVTTNDLGLPVPCSGNFADVYAVECASTKNKWAVKCFTREIAGLKERYREISAYLKQTPLPFMVDFTYLEQGIRMRGQWFPILKMQWVEGFALNTFVKNNLDKVQVLDMLAQIWVKMAAKLREAQMAHCDIQHGNVLLVPGSKATSLAVKLVDYDGMCIPALTMLKSAELGHPNFQHPQRAKEGIYSLEVDRFSHLVVYMALRALIVGGHSLWEKFDNGDNLLFRKADFEAPDKSELFAELAKLNDPRVKTLVAVLHEACKNPLDQAPVLDDLAPKPKQSTARGSTQTATKVAPKEQSAADLFASATATSPTRKTPKSKPNSKAPVLVGFATAAVVGLIAVIAGGFIIMSGNKADKAKETSKVVGNDFDQIQVKAKTDTTSDPKREPKVEPKPEPMPSDPNSLELPSVTASTTQEKVDLLKLIKPEKHALGGSWQLNDKGLISDRGGILQIPYTPGDEYVLKVRVERKRGTDALGIGLVADNHQFAAILDGWGGQFSGFVLDGKGPESNEEAGRKGQTLLADKPVEIDFTILKKSITITVNGNPLLSWKGDYKRLSAHGWNTPDKRALYLSSFGSAFEITRFDYVPISGKGTRLEPVDPSAPSATRSPSVSVPQSITARKVAISASGNNGHEIRVNGILLMKCNRDGTTSGDTTLKEGDVIAVRLGDRFDIMSLWLRCQKEDGTLLFETSDKWTAYLPVDKEKWWDVKQTSSTQRAAYASDSREYIDLVKKAASKVAPKAGQPIYSPLKGKDGEAYLYYIVDAGRSPDGPPTAQKKTPVPDETAQANALKNIKDIFKEDYTKKKPGEMSSLASKLLQQGSETKDDPVSQFVLLREASDVAARACDAIAVAKAIDELAKRFDVNSEKMKADALEKVAGSVLATPSSTKVLVEVALATEQDAVAADEYAVVTRLIKVASAAARKLKNVSLLNRVQARSKDVEALKKEYEKIKASLEILSQEPENQEANFAVGKFRCFVKGDWERGLLLLTKGSDTKIRAVAAKDLAQPTDADEQMTIGHEWWEIAESSMGMSKINLQRRAYKWYAEALPMLVGSNKAKVERRVAEIEKILPRESTDLLKLISPEKNAIVGKWQFSGERLICDATHLARLQIPYSPGDEYVLKIRVERKQEVSGIGVGFFCVGVVSGANQFQVGLDSFPEQGYFSGLVSLDGKDPTMNETGRKGQILKPNQPRDITITVRNKSIAIVVDERALVNWAGNYNRLAVRSEWVIPKKHALFIGSHGCVVEISRLEYLPLTGKGKFLE